MDFFAVGAIFRQGDAEIYAGEDIFCPPAFLLLSTPVGDIFYSLGLFFISYCGIFHPLRSIFRPSSNREG